MARSKPLLRFGMRSLLVVMTLLCVWIGGVTGRARSQKVAAERIADLGGSVRYSYEIGADGRDTGKRKPAAPAWMVETLGPDYFRSVVVVRFDKPSDPSDEALAVVSRFTGLRGLVLHSRRNITDEGLRHLSRLRSLEGLTLSSTRVGDQGLACLTGLRSLKWITLDNTPITDEGIKHIAKLRSLEELHIRGTRITDEGLMQLAACKHLKRVRCGMRVTEEGRARLQAALPQCRVSVAIPQ